MMWWVLFIFGAWFVISIPVGIWVGRRLCWIRETTTRPIDEEVVPGDGVEPPTRRPSTGRSTD